MPFINCKVSLILAWSKNCVLIDMATHAAVPISPINAPTNATLKITDTKLYIPVVTLSTKNYNKLLEQLKTGFKRTIKWNKYRSKMSNQTENNNLNYLIDLTLTKDNRLFVLSFENEDQMLELKTSIY